VHEQRKKDFKVGRGLSTCGTLLHDACPLLVRLSQLLLHPAHVTAYQKLQCMGLRQLVHSWPCKVESGHVVASCTIWETCRQTLCSLPMLACLHVLPSELENGAKDRQRHPFAPPDAPTKQPFILKAAGTRAGSPVSTPPSRPVCRECRLSGRAKGSRTGCFGRWCADWRLWLEPSRLGVLFFLSPDVCRLRTIHVVMEVRCPEDASAGNRCNLGQID
jgi:hypothetical protein